MKINGKEVKMRYSVRARLNIAALCPDKKFERIGDLFGNTEEESVEALIKVGQLLNSEYERNAKRERGEATNPDENYAVFTADDIYSLSIPELNEFDDMVTKTIFGDSTTTVEAKPGKKTGKKTTLN